MVASAPSSSDSDLSTHCDIVAAVVIDQHRVDDARRLVDRADGVGREALRRVLDRDHKFVEFSPGMDLDAGNGFEASGDLGSSSDFVCTTQLQIFPLMVNGGCLGDSCVNCIGTVTSGWLGILDTHQERRGTVFLLDGCQLVA